MIAFVEKLFRNNIKIGLIFILLFIPGTFFEK